MSPGLFCGLYERPLRKRSEILPVWCGSVVRVSGGPQKLANSLAVSALIEDEVDNANLAHAFSVFRP